MRISLSDGNDRTGRAIDARRGIRSELPSSLLIVIESEKKSTFAAISTGIRKKTSTMRLYVSGNCIWSRKGNGEGPRARVRNANALYF